MPLHGSNVCSVTSDKSLGGGCFGFCTRKTRRMLSASRIVGMKCFQGADAGKTPGPSSMQEKIMFPLN